MMFWTSVAPLPGGLAEWLTTCAGKPITKEQPRAKVDDELFLIRLNGGQSKWHPPQSPPRSCPVLVRVRPQDSKLPKKRFPQNIQPFRMIERSLKSHSTCTIHVQGTHSPQWHCQNFQSPACLGHGTASASKKGISRTAAYG